MLVFYPLSDVVLSLYASVFIVNQIEKQSLHPYMYIFKEFQLNETLPLLGLTRLLADSTVTLSFKTRSR